MSANPALHLVAEVPLRPMTPAVVLFGRDDAGRPRAAWFDISEAKLAARAAEVMKLRILPLANDEQRDFADQLSHGRVFGSGRAFVPYVRRDLFPRLLELAGEQIEPGAALPAAAANQDPPAATGKPTSAAARGVTATAQPPAAPRPEPFVGHKQPRDRDEIGLGSIVLAHEGPGEGWWEAEVIGINGAVHSLRWRDYPTDPTILRRADELALLPPTKA
ncbi:hypothetical protein [uncultured Methylobacterium sp.]|jgi:hypothetical protein|uniref:hypothetical protein n=1 Tax=uncultured Methylobacterium sp. TaxID=157278 RepID=UPI00262E54FF|nr:hypothetical protein [uncultured Methylobacterium sp.]